MQKRGTKEMSKDLVKVQKILQGLSDTSRKVTTAGGSGTYIEKRIETLIKAIEKLRNKYEDSAVMVEGFSISLGVALVNSSATVNFKFREKKSA